MPWRYAVIVACYCAFIFWMSSQPDPPVPQQLFPGFDKLEHIGAYGVMDALVLFGMKKSPRPHTLARLLWVPLLFTIAFGFTDEFHQHFVPHRNVDPEDIVADTVGAALAQAVLLRYAFGHSCQSLREALRPARTHA